MAVEYDGGWGWVVVAASFMISVLVDGVRYSYGLLYLEFLDEFDRGKGETSWIGSIMFGTYGLAAPLASIVIDKYGCRCSVILGSIVTFASFVISMFATSVYYLYFTFGLLGGFGSVLMMLPVNVVIVQYFDKKRSLAMGIAMCGSGAGTVIFNPLSKFLIDEYNWRGALLIDAALILNVAILGSAMRPIKHAGKENTNAVATELDTMLTDGEANLVTNLEPEYQTERVPIENGNQKAAIHKHLTTKKDSDDDLLQQGLVDSNNEATGIEQNTTETRRINERITTATTADEQKKTTRCIDYKAVTDALRTIYHFELLKNAAVLIFMLSVIFIGLSFMVPFTFLPDMVVSFGLTRGDATWMLTAIGIANVVIRVPAGLVGDRQCISRWKVYLASTMVAGISIALMSLTRNYLFLMAVCTIFGLAIGIALVLLPVILADIFGDDLIADSYGLILFASGISELLGTPLAGWVFDGSGTYLIPFTMAGAEYFLAGVLLLVVPHFQPSHK